MPEKESQLWAILRAQLRSIGGEEAILKEEEARGTYFKCQRKQDSPCQAVAAMDGPLESAGGATREPEQMPVLRQEPQEKLQPLKPCKNRLFLPAGLNSWSKRLRFWTSLLSGLFLLDFSSRT